MIGNSKPSIALIGPGRLGQAVTALLRQQGYPITAIVGRDRQRTAEAAHFVGAELMATTDINRCTPADIILIATGDDQLAPIAAQLCATVALRDTTLLVHCSGLHPAKVLKHSADMPQQVLAMHPLQTFASSEQGMKSLAGCYFSLEGDTEAIKQGQQLVGDLGGESFIIEGQYKARYHAAACMAANFITTLIDSAGEVLSQCNPHQEIPLTVLGPLIRTAVENSLTLGPKTALTGPIVRGDDGTVTSHLEQLKQHHPDLVALYQQLGLQTVDLAQRSNRLSVTKGEKIANILTQSLDERKPD